VYIDQISFFFFGNMIPIIVLIIKTLHAVVQFQR